ncbi:uncharacterized protein V6R79_004010 [Siganus canaliculatus]
MRLNAAERDPEKWSPTQEVTSVPCPYLHTDARPPDMDLARSYIPELKEQMVAAKEGASIVDSTWTRTQGAVTFSPSEFFSVCCEDDLRFHPPVLTSTPICSLKHVHGGLEECCLQCSQMSPDLRDLWMSAPPPTPTPLKINSQDRMKVCWSSVKNLECDNLSMNPDGRQPGSSSSEVSHTLLSSSLLQVQGGSPKRLRESEVQRESSSTSAVHRKSSSTLQVYVESTSFSEVHRETRSSSDVFRDCSPILEVYKESSPVPPDQGESGSGQQRAQHRDTRCVLGCEDFGCFPVDAQVEVWWCQQPVSYLHSPECPAYRLNPFETPPSSSSPRNLQRIYFRLNGPVSIIQ